MAEKKTMESTEPRRAPVQDRSIRRVNTILEVTAELVREKGVDGVKTTEIARRAGIKLASLYRYFPNKNAILKSLVEHQFEKIRPRLAGFLETFDLENGLNTLIDTYAAFYHSEPGFTQLWSGLQAIPELHQIDLEDLHQNATMISKRVAQLMPHVSEEELYVIAAMVARTAGSILRLTLTMEEPRASMMVEELKTMLSQYVVSRLEQFPRP